MTMSWIRIDTEFCSNCWLMLRSVFKSALAANTTSCRTAMKMIMFTLPKTSPGSHWTPSEFRAIRSGRWATWIVTPCTTVLISIIEMAAETTGTRPASAVVMKRPMVVGRLASQTRRSTCGSAAVVPAIDCLRLSQRPRRSLGPSGCCGGSSVGSPVRPLLAGPDSGLRRRRPIPPHQITGPCPPGGIIPIGLGAYRSSHFPLALAM